MRIWFDTEFLEDGKTIELISIGMIREDGQTLYRETCSAVDLCAKSDWLKKNVMPHLKLKPSLRETIAKDVRDFAGFRPEFWAYYADYDWVVLCQLFGRMIDLPDTWPMYCRDVKQLCDTYVGLQLPEQKTEHDALADAIWAKHAWEFLQGHERSKRIERGEFRPPGAHA